MTRNVWVLPVGLEFDRVLDVLRAGGQAFYVIASQSRDHVGAESRGFAARVCDFLQAGPFDLRGYREVNVLNLGDCIRCLHEIQNAEDRVERDTVINVNIATSSKIMTLASLYAASKTPDRFRLHYPRASTYTVMEIVAAAEIVVGATGAEREEALRLLTDRLQQYKKRGSTARENSQYEAIEIPVIPMQELSEAQRAILTQLMRYGSFESGRDLAEDLRAGESTLKWAKSTVSFALRDLIKWQLVRLSQEKRGKRITITDAGRLYCEAFLEGPPTLEGSRDS